MDRFSGRQLALVGAIAAVVLILAGSLMRHTDAADARASPGSSFRQAAREVAASTSVGGLVVDVSGAVRRPGVYTLSLNARVGDAIQRAGGFARDAVLSSVNRAAKVVDGQQIVVASRAATGASSAGVAMTDGGAVSGPVSLNAATASQLDELPGVGPTTAQKIVDDRTANGPFASIDELDRVDGIGPGTVERLREQLTL